MKSGELRDLLTLREVAAILKCHPNTLRLWDKRGILKAVRLGFRRARRYRRGDLVEFLTKGNGNEGGLEAGAFYKVVEQTADPVIITDPIGQIRYVNLSFEGVTGYKKQEVLGETPRVIKSGIHPQQFYKKLWETILSGKTYRNTIVNRKKNGELFYADHTITPIKDAKGKIVYFLGLWKDVTSQVELEKRRDEFISIASHELKTPLTSFKAYIQILRKYVVNGGKQKTSALLSRMNDQVDRLSELVADLLDVTKIQSGKLVLKKEYFSLDELVKAVVEDLTATIKSSGNSQHITVRGKIGKDVKGDYYRISQVLSNLLNNASKYSTKDGRIEVILSADETAAKVCVRDFGIGISKEDQKRVFDRFYRVDRYHERDRFASLGLGLYISAEIIKQHGGRIWVESEEGDGSEFCFTIPLKPR